MSVSEGFFQGFVMAMLIIQFGVIIFLWFRTSSMEDTLLSVDRRTSSIDRVSDEIRSDVAYHLRPESMRTVSMLTTLTENPPSTRESLVGEAILSYAKRLEITTEEAEDE